MPRIVIGAPASHGAPAATAGLNRGTRSADVLLVGPVPHGRDKRQSPRIDVFLRVAGELTDLQTPVLVHDLSRTGFAVVSHIAFQPGQTLDFRITGPGTPPFTLSAEAVHTSPMGNPAGLHLSGFKFVPGRVIATVPVVLIDQLIAAISAEDRQDSIFDDVPA